MGRGSKEELEPAALSPGRRPGTEGEREGRVPSRLELSLFWGRAAGNGRKMVAKEKKG